MSETASTQPTPSTTETPPAHIPRRLGTFEQAAEENRVAERTVRNYLGQGHFKGYRMRGVRGLLLDLDEVAVAMRDIRRKGGWGTYGPDAVIIDIPRQPVVVPERQNR
jgi:hypothetical protein